MKKFLLTLFSGLLLTTCAFAETPFLDKVITYTVKTGTLTTTTSATGGGGNHNVLDPYVVVNYIIKY